MIRVLNRHNRWLMIIIAILAIPFIFYFNKTDLGATSNDNFGRLYGRTLTQIEFQRNARLLRLSSDLGMSNFIQDLTTGAQSESDAYHQFMLNRLVVRHEAEALGLEPSPAEIADVVKSSRAFHGDAGFDINKYNEFTKSELGPMGFTEAQIEEVAADQLRLTKLKNLIGVGVHIPESESKSNYERAYGKIDATVVRLHSADFEKDVTIGDPDIAKYFEGHKAQLNTDEKRKVKLVALTLTDEQKKLTGKERIEPLQELADRANELSQALLEKGADFDQVAAKFQLPVVETGEFTVKAPDPHLASNAQLSQTAFQLTEQDPNSDAVQGSDGFYVLHLTGVVPARPLTLEEAKPKIVDTLKAERLQQVVSAKAAEAAQKIREAVKAGQPADAAVQQIALKAEKIPPFSLIETPPTPPAQPKDPKTDAPDLPQIKQAAADLEAGEVSDFVPTKDGGLVVLVEKREPPDQAKAKEGRTLMDSRYIRGKREVAFYEWLRDRRKAAGVKETQPEAQLPG